MKANEIRELRENLGLSQTKFAQLLGVSASSVSYWENDERKPPQIYIASMIKLREKLSGINDEDEKQKMIEKILGFLLVGGIIAFLVWVFTEEKK